MKFSKRTHTCGELNASAGSAKVLLSGWVYKNRNHGGIHFMDLRDRYGITQIVIDENAPKELKETASRLKFEYCVSVSGTVRMRPESMINKEMSTGEIEISADDIIIHSSCDTLPFMVDGEAEAREELRLKYRYLDLRTERMQSNIALRHKTAFAVREYLNSRDFYEIETPTFIKTTPEGARDFIVPSRLYPGKAFALPQSPQIYKQLLMVSGFDKYFQIARCYRDEDARGDRQPEFTQIDIEMSFVDREDVLSLTEGMMNHVFEKTLSVKLPDSFRRLTYHEAMDLYGTDKPDLRFDLQLGDITNLVKESEFGVFRSAAESGGCVKFLNAKGCGAYSRKQITELEETAKIYKAKGLAWMKVTESGIDGGISKFFKEMEKTVIEKAEAQPGDLLLFAADNWRTACTSLGAVRARLASDLGLIDKEKFEFAWIIDFPLFEWNEEENKWDPAHHMFSMPQAQYLDTMEKDPGPVKGDLYDLVLNGYEIASGSIRVHDPVIQKRIFSIVGFSEEEAMSKFGFLLDSFRFGPPPHGGIAPGLDRLVMLMCKEPSIREVIAFPKNTAGLSPLDSSPSELSEVQRKELHIEFTQEEAEK
ncbi:MAG: aspartate--tRNA ligase [Spirochaetia bacterium]|jgi:aspartyl-tRNA synthetase|nr:aspartate--tRNA ligase [Spirochaetia bacterium]